MVVVAGFACEVWLKKKKTGQVKESDYCGLCLKFASLIWGEERYSLKPKWTERK